MTFANADPARTSEDAQSTHQFDRVLTDGCRSPILLEVAKVHATAPEVAGRVARMRRKFGIKRLCDVTLAALTLGALAPVLLAVAAAIRLSSPGPALFRQERHGLDGKTFEILKFRTMYQDAGDPSGVRQTRAADPRVTPLGRWLRRSNIDELPQLINVLQGDMSLVGPRPHVPNMRAGGVVYEELVPYYFARHCVRPGLTGLAQMNGLRGPTQNGNEARARIDYDLAYIERWSFVLDLRILLTTAWAECLGGRGI